MFGRKKKEKFYVELNPAEVKIFVTALMNFRNECMALGKPTEEEELEALERAQAMEKYGELFKKNNDFMG